LKKGKMATRKTLRHVHSQDGPSPQQKKGPEPVNSEALRRLKNIEGQVRGLQRMVEEEKYCIDIVTQLSAVRAALNQVGLLVLRRHVEHCVVDAIRSPDRLSANKIIDELMAVLLKGER
jgi:DNA-binding FrmR family transcriptional regulator